MSADFPWPANEPKKKGEFAKKKNLALVLSLVLVCLALPALADVTVNGHVHPGGMYADTVTVTMDGPAMANYYYEYQVEVVGRNGNTPLNVYDAQNPEFMEWLFAQ